MSYRTINDSSIFSFEEKKSEFIGRVKYVSTEEEAKEFLNKVKNENKEARHNVFAYVIGEKKNIQRYSDDGEPQGTGGIPILEVIKKNDLTDVVVVVTRYFGGILLGTGGLTRAYIKGAAEAVAKAEVLEKVKGYEVRLNLDYDLLGKIQYYFEQNNWITEEIAYTDKVEIMLYIEDAMLETFIQDIKNISSSRVENKISDFAIYFKSAIKLYKL